MLWGKGNEYYKLEPRLSERIFFFPFDPVTPVHSSKKNSHESPCLAAAI